MYILVYESISIISFVIVGEKMILKGLGPTTALEIGIFETGVNNIRWIYLNIHKKVHLYILNFFFKNPQKNNLGVKVGVEKQGSRGVMVLCDCVQMTSGVGPKLTCITLYTI